MVVHYRGRVPPVNTARTSATMVAAQWRKGRKRQRETKLSTTPRIMSTADAWRFSLTVCGWCMWVDVV